VASPNEHEAFIRCDKFGKGESGSSLPLSGTLELPSDRPAGAHSAELTQPPEYRRLCEVRHGYGCVHTAYQQPRPCFSRELVYAKSTSRRKLSARCVP
jgi:hypothetical protein